VVCLVAVDLLGWTIRGSVGGGGIPPVHTESSGYQGVGVLPEQPYELVVDGEER